MIPLLTNVFSSMRKELAIALGVVIALCVLPIAAITSLTNVSILTNSAYRLYQGQSSTSNTYIFGYCTFWAAKRRGEVGKPIPNSWGNANTWGDYARREGYLVDDVPTPESILQTSTGQLGHVAFVEDVHLDGSWTISEMNAVGWDIVDQRTFTAAQAKSYNFIH